MKLFGFHINSPTRTLKRKMKKEIREKLWGDSQERFRGKIGEMKVSFTTSFCFDTYKQVIRNIYLHFYNGKTTEVDEIIITSSGIYVFEIKNYKGWIFGNENNREWTQVLSIGGGDTEKNHFYNPIHQNRTHINCIRNIIRDNSVPIHSIVVFTDQSVFKNVSSILDDVYVIHRSELKRTINIIDKKYCGKVLNSKIDIIYNQLISNSNSSDSKEHINQVRSNKEQKIEPLLCPLCGSRLVLRTSRKGNNVGNQFYGCSSFPKCRYTRNKVKDTKKGQTQKGWFR